MSISDKPSPTVSSASDRNAAGISSNSDSMSGTPMAASMDATSASVWGMNGMAQGARNAV